MSGNSDYAIYQTRTVPRNVVNMGKPAKDAIVIYRRDATASREGLTHRGDVPHAEQAGRVQASRASHAGHLVQMSRASPVKQIIQTSRASPVKQTGRRSPDSFTEVRGGNRNSERPVAVIHSRASCAPQSSQKDLDELKSLQAKQRDLSARIVDVVRRMSPDRARSPVIFSKIGGARASEQASQGWNRLPPTRDERLNGWKYGYPDQQVFSSRKSSPLRLA